MSRILCIANQKGGVGKTTTAVNLSAALARAGQRTILIDLDPQCNATSSLGHEPAARHPLVCDASLSDLLVPTSIEGLQILPGSQSFADIEALITDDGTHSATLSHYLASGMAAFDFVLIDCPPSLGRLTQTALASATEVLIPIQCEYFAMEGLAQMIEVIKQVMQQNPKRLAFGGILLTMFDPYLDLTHEVDAEVREFFGEIVFQTAIPRDVAVAEAPSHGQPVLDYAPRARGTRAYVELCMEVLERD